MAETTLVLALLLVLTALGTAVRHPRGMLLGLLCYLPFETLMVRGLDPIATAVCRYGSESVIYVLAASAFVRRERGGGHPTPIAFRPSGPGVRRIVALEST